MPTEKKESTVAELKALVARSDFIVGAEYRGLSVKDMTNLRRGLRQAGVEARVVKNRLFKLAAEQAGVAAAGDIVEGPTLVIFASGDAVAPSKAIAEYARTSRTTFAPKKAFFEGAVVAGSVVTELATLPPREELIGRLAGALISPMQQFVNLIDDSLRSFARLVEARAAQLEEAA